MDTSGKVLGTVKRPPNKRSKTWRSAAAAARRDATTSTAFEAPSGEVEAAPERINSAAAGDGTGFSAAAGDAAPYEVNYFEDRQFVVADAPAALDGGIHGADAAGDIAPHAVTDDIDYRQ